MTIRPDADATYAPRRGSLDVARRRHHLALVCIHGMTAALFLTTTALYAASGEWVAAGIAGATTACFVACVYCYACAVREGGPKL